MYVLAFTRSSCVFQVATVNLQVTILKLLVSYPNGMARVDDLKRDMAILAKSGRDWSERTRRLAARVPDLSIFSMGLVERNSFGWHITAHGRAVLADMESHSAAAENSSTPDNADVLELAGVGRELPSLTPNPRRRTGKRSGWLRRPRTRIA